MKIKKWAPVVLAGLLLTGCGQTVEDKIADDMEVVIEQDETIDKEEDASPKAFPESIKVINPASGQSIDVPVVSDGIADAAVYPITEKELNTETLKERCNRLFDRDSMEFKKPYEVCSEKELKEIKDILKEKDLPDQSQEITETFYQALHYEADQEVGVSFDPNEPLVSSERKEMSMDENFNMVSQLEPIKTARATGLIDGAAYELRYKERPGKRKFELYSVEPHYPFFSMMASTGDGIPGYDENMCDREQALNTAWDLLLKLGIAEKYDVSREAINVVRIDEKNVLDGYTFFFLPKIENAFAGLDGVRSVCQVNTAENTTTGETSLDYAEIMVDHQGVVSAEFNDLYEMGEPLSDTLISTEQLEEEIAKEMERFTYFEDKEFADLGISVRYMPVRKESGMVYVPTWSAKIERDAKSSGYMYSLGMHLFSINALDGGVIYTTNLAQDL